MIVGIRLQTCQQNNNNLLKLKPGYPNKYYATLLVD
jgi:hypothetical protein